MHIYTWWDGDTIGATGLDASLVRVGTDDDALAVASGLSISDIVSRRARGHRPYIALEDGQTAGYGWVATRVGAIDRFNLKCELPPGQRLLWDLEALSEIRPDALYVALLRAMLRHEPADRFWIAISGKQQLLARCAEWAGFTSAGRLMLVRGEVFLVAPRASRGTAAATLLKVPLAQHGLAAP